MNRLGIALELVGGLGLFLYGMRVMSSGLHRLAGKRLRAVVQTLTKNSLSGVLTGVVVTALIQSSSATTIMVVGLVDAGVMTLGQAIAVILGASIGTTITTQMISLELTALAEPAIIIGALVILFGRKRSWKPLGEFLLGFGILFFGMKTMSGAMVPLRTYPPFVAALGDLGSHPVTGVTAGAIFTALVQSSSATTGIIVALASQGVLSLQGALPLVLGSNIGTTITALIASLTAKREAKRAALAHLIFNTGGVLLFMSILRPFAVLTASTSSVLARQVANAHTIFNVVSVLVVLPFIPLLEALVCWLIKADSLEQHEHPHEISIHTSELAAKLHYQRQTGKICEAVEQMFNYVTRYWQTGDIAYHKLVSEKAHQIQELEQQTLQLLAIAELSGYTFSHNKDYAYHMVNYIGQVAQCFDKTNKLVLAEMNEQELDLLKGKLTLLAQQLAPLIQDLIRYITDEDFNPQQAREKIAIILGLESETRQSLITELRARQVNFQLRSRQLNIMWQLRRVAELAREIMQVS